MTGVSAIAKKSLRFKIILYVMASFGENQEHTQILNKYDPCCFSGTYQDSYPILINQFLSKNGLGNFEFITDDTHFEHKISDFAFDLISKKIVSSS